MNRERRYLPVVSSGCDRRTALHGITLGALGLLGCRVSLESEPGDGPADAAIADGVPDAAPDLGFEVCGTDLCFDLTHPSNVALRTVDGSRVVAVKKKKYLLIRTTETGFTALSGLCTHGFCTVRYHDLNGTVLCPCHGSRFRLDGSVIGGPAPTPLQVFPTLFDAAAERVTIEL